MVTHNPKIMKYVFSKTGLTFRCADMAYCLFSQSLPYISADIGNFPVSDDLVYR